MTDTILTRDNNYRIRTLQGARFLFVFMIYLSHCITPSTTTPFDFGGESGVAFFFMLSGFVLSWGYGPRVSRGEFSERKFFWRHFWRLYPLHVLMLVMFLALDWHAGIRYDALQLLSNLLVFQSWLPSNHTLYTLNGVAWFLCDTLFFYALFGWLYRRLVRMEGWRFGITIAEIAIGYGFSVACIPDDMVNCTLYVNPLLRTVDFAIGIMTYRAVKTMRPDTLPNIARYGACVAAALVAATYVLYQYLPCGMRCAMLFWLTMPMVVAGLAVSSTENDPVARILASRPVVWLGGISFEMFMSHLLVMRIVQHVVELDGTAERDMAYFAVSFAATVVVAWGLHRLVVKPAGEAINRRFLR